MILAAAVPLAILLYLLLSMHEDARASRSSFERYEAHQATVEPTPRVPRAPRTPREQTVRKRAP